MCLQNSLLLLKPLERNMAPCNVNAERAASADRITVDLSQVRDEDTVLAAPETAQLINDLPIDPFNTELVTALKMTLMVIKVVIVMMLIKVKLRDVAI